MSMLFSSYTQGLIKTLSDFRFWRREQMTKDDPKDESFTRFLGEFSPHKYGDWSRLQRPSHFQTDVYLRQLDRADWQHVDWRLELWASLFQLAMKRHNVPLFVHSAFRTHAEQAELFRLGRTKTKWPRAAHCQGAAVDIVHGIYAWDLSRQEWDNLRLVGQGLAERLNQRLKQEDRLPLVWGGNWDFYDPAHWELAGWRNHVRTLESEAPQRRTPDASRKRLANLAA